MSRLDIFIGNSKLDQKPKKVTGEYCIVEKVEYFKISNYDLMRPFFMTIVSGSDQWLFISSNGALSAGRKNSNSALFPYYTDDKITDSAEITGSKTLFRVEKDGKTYLWEPFSERYSGIYSIKRNIYKSRIGDRILFEEINEDLDLSFNYLWTFSDRFGFVKKSTLKNLAKREVKIELLDGLQNILPFGVNSDLQNSKSTLVDAYKKNELDVKSGIGIYSLSAMIVDKAEPSEALLATTSWSAGIDIINHLLCSNQLDKFRKGHSLTSENEVRAERGAYFINSKISLQGLEESVWYIISDVNQSLNSIADIQGALEDRLSLVEELEKDIKSGSEDLLRKIGTADGLQCTDDKLSTGRHLSNTLFNIMRGGVFEDQYKTNISDLRNFFTQLNKSVFEKNVDFINNLKPGLQYQTLISEAGLNKDVDLERLCYEYLPLSFSRRHGDPSRPWNIFSIESKDSTGQKINCYEGNWRDIFQNWEALALSFPEYIEGMITKFVNASTIDGYNPYRISRNGIDWEVVEPDDPWSFIGYWGDHQIIYLLKLLELSSAHHPDRLIGLLSKPLNVYANVPYKIKSYQAILEDPSDTIVFDQDLANVIDGRTKRIGADGKLVWNTDDEIIRANLAEKILVVVLTKLYNFIPEAGIWLNTQRPEWNDANNALVGNGASMVTLYYLNRFLKFGIKLFSELGASSVELNQPVAQLLESIDKIFNSRISDLQGGLTDEARKKIMDDLGRAGEGYRVAAYKGFTGKKQSFEPRFIVKMFETSLHYLQHSIEYNKRSDGLYHSYNLIEIDNTKAEAKHMYEMLEGQVAILSAQFLSAEESSLVLDALKQSKMFRPDQYSYLLYPDRELPLFLEKNCVSEKFVNESMLLKTLFANKIYSLIEEDKNGLYHFNGLFHNVNDLIAELNKLSKLGYSDLVHKEYDSFLEVFEEVFDHKSFTGRSGTFYGYEGLGSIYWHMVSKLLLATQENIALGNREGADSKTMGRLIDHYYEIRAGIGINKTPDLYGAFPTDAYSHTPGNMGAQQPGMTGQVKEDIINRWAELGVTVKDGRLSFKPLFLKGAEYLKKEESFVYFDIKGNKRVIHLPKGSLAFTYCQVPIVYVNGQDERIEVLIDGNSIELNENMLSKTISSEIFKRTGKVESIYCSFKPKIEIHE